MRTPLADHLLDYLGEGPSSPVAHNLTTVMRQGQAAQEWLLVEYLGAWLDLISGLVTAEYPLAVKYAGAIRAIGRLKHQLSAELDVSEQVFFLKGLEDSIKGVARFTGVATERSMQWGIWGKDIPASIGYGFSETDVLSPLICEGIAPVCMYAAFLVSQVVTDEGVAEEVADKMFETMPRQLLELLRGIPSAPEA
jgi:hypothetical protein